MTLPYNMEEEVFDDSSCVKSFIEAEEPKVSFNVLLQEGEHELVPTHLSKLLNQLTQLSEERFLEAFLESGPQAILQLYITIICKTNMNDSAIISVTSSLCSLALAISDYTDHKFRKHPLKGDLTMLGNLTVFLWKLPTVSARCVSLAIFASGRDYSGHKILFAIFLVHTLIGASWEFYNLDKTLVMGGWILKAQQCPRKVWRFLRMLVRILQRGWIFNFTILEYPTHHYDQVRKTWVEVDEKKPLRPDEPHRSMWQLLFFNILLSLENIFLVLIWFSFYAKKKDPQGYNIPLARTLDMRLSLLGGTAVSFQLGLISMAIFYVLKHSTWITKTSKHSKDQFLRLAQRHVELNHDNSILDIFERCNPADLQMLFSLHDLDGYSLFSTACSQEIVNIKIVGMILNYGGFPNESVSQNQHDTQWLYLERIFSAIYFKENEDLGYLLRQFGFKLQLRDVAEFPPMKFAAEVGNAEAEVIIQQFLASRYGQYLDFAKFMTPSGKGDSDSDYGNYNENEMHKDRSGSHPEQQSPLPLPPIPLAAKEWNHEGNNDEVEDDEEEIYDDILDVGKTPSPTEGMQRVEHGLDNKGYEDDEFGRKDVQLRQSKRRAKNWKKTFLSTRARSLAEGPKKVSISEQDGPRYFAIVHSNFESEEERCSNVKTGDKLMVLEDEDDFWVWVRSLRNNEEGTLRVCVCMCVCVCVCVCVFYFCTSKN